MFVKLKGTTGLPFEVTEVNPIVVKCDYSEEDGAIYADNEGNFYKEEELEFIDDEVESYIVPEKKETSEIYLTKSEDYTILNTDKYTDITVTG